MNYLLLGGAPKVGKSESICRFIFNLVAKGFKVVQGSVPSQERDFRVILEGPDANGNIERILINTASDTQGIIEEFQKFRKKLAPCDF